MAESKQVPQALVELVESGKPREVAVGYLEHFRKDLEMALNYDQVSSPRGGSLTFQSFAASVSLEVSTNPRLVEAMNANPASMMKALSLAAQCKLLVGSAYHLFYLIPRWNGREKRLEVSPLIGYKGLSEMAQRHPRVHKVDANLVFEGEEFDYDAGAGKLTHKVNLMGDRSEEKCIGGYARVVITEPNSTRPVSDDPVIHPMSRGQIIAVRARSDAWVRAEKSGKRNSPWHTDWMPMWRKTLLRAVLNGGSVPRDMGVGAAITADDQAQVIVEEPRKSLPKQTRGEGLRTVLGIDEAPPPVAPFDFAEEAAAALDECESVEEMKLLRDRFAHFEGGDADVVRNAWDRNEARFD